MSIRGVSSPNPRMTECVFCFGCFDDSVTLCPLDGASVWTPFAGPRLVDSKYLVEQRLGAGGMGVIYRALHVGLRRRFALKLLSARAARGDAFLERFRTEAEALGNLEHRHIVDVSDFGVDPREGGLPYLVMELLDGTSFDQYCRMKGPLAPDELLKLMEPVAEAIDFAHERGILHRDLKPANLFLARENDGVDVKVVDFGLARRTRPREDLDVSIAPATNPVVAAQREGGGDFDQSNVATSRLDPALLGVATAPISTILGDKTESGAVVGTPGYMAPEIIRGHRATAASDIYSFGVILYEALTSSLPYDGFGAELLTRALSEDPTPPSKQRRGAGLAELDEPLLRMLDRDASRRPASAREALAALRAAWYRVELRTWRAREVPRRIAWAAAATLMLFVASVSGWRSQSVTALEDKLLDARFATSQVEPASEKIAIVVFDDDTLADDGMILSHQPDQIAADLETLFAAGARAVSIDMLLPETWSGSQAFSRFVLQHADRVTLALQSDSRQRVIGANAIGGLTSVALGPDRTERLFGFADTEVAGDGVTRRAHATFRDRNGKEWPSLALKSAQYVDGNVSATSPFTIDFRVDRTRYPVIAWKELRTVLARQPSIVRDRVVIVGADFVGSGDEAHRIPRVGELPEQASGPMLQAIITDTLIRHTPLRAPNQKLVAIFAAALAGALFAALLLRRERRVTLLIAGTLALAYVVIAWLAFRGGAVLPIAGPLLTVALGVGAGMAVRARMAPFPLPPNIDWRTS
jgi:serine/threonine protein kinase/CHASE2 domain-containing sensor protein